VWLKAPYFWLLAHACPAPRVVLLLDAPGQVMFARKGEFDPEHLERERGHFRELGEQLRGVVVLDASQPESELGRSAIAALWAVERRRQARHV
jgi:hypothetical protein